MRHALPDQAITKRTVAGDDICYFSPCSGVAFTMKAAERSQFALGQLVALGIVRRLGRIQRSGSAARDRQKTRRQSRQRLLDPECQFDNQCQQQRCGQGHRSS